MAVLTLWSSCMGFANSFLGPGSSPSLHATILPKGKLWSDVSKHFEQLKRLTNLINQTFGKMTTCFLAAAIIDHAITLDEIIAKASSSDWSKWIGLIFYFGDTIVVLSFAANICHQVKIKMKCNVNLRSK